jgi:hypothetical protein
MSNTPTRIVVNLQTGEITEVELEGEELAAYQAALAAQTESEGNT